MSNVIVCGLQEPFREISESGYRYFNFGDETVNPIDAPECMPAGSVRRCMAPDEKEHPMQRSFWRAQ